MRINSSRFLVVLLITGMVACIGVGNARAFTGNDADQPMQRTAGYLLSKERSSGPLSPWSYIALAAAGQDLTRTQVGRAAEKMLAAALSSGETNDYAVLVLTVLTAGGDPAEYQGYDLLRKLKGAQLANGKFADNVTTGGEQLVNAHIWAVLALYTAGAAVPDKDAAVEWLTTHQHPDGSFCWNAADMSTADVDTTGAALMALGALGLDDKSTAVERAVGFLQRAQKENGGFESWGIENPESCAMVIEGLLSVGADPSEGFSRAGGGLLDALLHFQLPDGSFEHVTGAGSNEMSTYQALLALADLRCGEPFFRRLNKDTQPAACKVDEKKREAYFTIGSSRYTVVLGECRQELVADAIPFIENGRAYVPLRYLASALGVPEAGIHWNAGSRTVNLKMGGTEVDLVIGNPVIKVNGRAKQMDAVPLIKSGRTYLPARFVAEAFGYRVDWDSTAGIVFIRY